MARTMPEILRLDIGERSPCGNTFSIRGLCCAPQLGIELRDEGLDELRRNQPLLEPVQHPHFDVVPADCQVIRANPLGSACYEAVPVGADDRVAAAAASTPEHATQQKAAPMHAVDAEFPRTRMARRASMPRWLPASTRSSTAASWTTSRSSFSSRAAPFTRPPSSPA